MSRRIAFLVGAIGFALASAAGGAAQNFPMLVTSRAAQGLFAALLALSALSLLTTTFSDPRERGCAFRVYGDMADVGVAIGLLLAMLIVGAGMFGIFLFLVRNPD